MELSVTHAWARSTARVRVFLATTIAALVVAAGIFLPAPPAAATGEPYTPSVPTCAQLSLLGVTRTLPVTEGAQTVGQLQLSGVGVEPVTVTFVPSDGVTAAAVAPWVANADGTLTVAAASLGCTLYNPPLPTCDNLAELAQDGDWIADGTRGRIVREGGWLVYTVQDPTIALTTDLGNGWGWNQDDDGNWVLSTPVDLFSCYTPEVPTCETVTSLEENGSLEVDSGVLTLTSGTIVFTRSSEAIDDGVFLRSGNGWVLTDDGTLEFDATSLSCSTSTPTPTGTTTATPTETATATTAPTSVAPSPTSTVTASGTQLAETGAQVTTIVLVALVLVIGGGAAALFVRRRQSD